MIEDGLLEMGEHCKPPREQSDTTQGEPANILGA